MAIAQRFGLESLRELKLSDRGRAILDAANQNNQGPPPWRARKSAEAKELAALCEPAPPGRMRIEHLDLADSLRMVFQLQAPAPCRDAGGEVRIGDRVLLGLVYPENALREQLPGYAYVEVLLPREIFHPSIAQHPGVPQALCLGQLPAAMRCVDLVLLSYGALTMQTLQLDQRDPLGVMNADAATWFQQNQSRLPLSRTAFLEAE